MCFYTKLKTFLIHEDLNVFISWVFRVLCRFEKIYREGEIKILGGVKPNDYSITVLDRGGSSKMITVDYIGGSKKSQKMIT